MLNVFTLNQRINESAGYTADVKSILEAVDEYEFVGSIDEASNEFAINLMDESVSFQEMLVGSEEVLAEAAMTNPDRLDTIQENVFTGIKEKVLAVINKIIAMVKGIIAKLKEFYYKLTGKTDKWAKAIKPRIAAAKNRTGYSDATAEMYSWDEEYITSGMSTAISKLMDNMSKTLNGMFDEAGVKAGKLGDRFGSMANTVKKGATDSTKGQDADSKRVANYVNGADEVIGELESTFKDIKAEFPKTVAGILGKNLSTASMEDLWKSMDTAVKGNEKTSQKYGNRVDAMLSTVEKSSKTIQTIQKAYDKHLNELGTLKKKAETAFDENKISSKLPEEGAKAGKRLMSTVGTYITSYLTMHEGAINTARDKNTKYLQEMASEYMSVLTKFAGIKSQAPKKDEQ